MKKSGPIKRIKREDIKSISTERATYSSSLVDQFYETEKAFQLRDEYSLVVSIAKKTIKGVVSISGKKTTPPECFQIK